MDNLAPASDQTVASSDSLPLEFRGNAGEFFRIWIVNTLLTILTLGIYSAWAKVRTRRYFLGNTYLAGSAFDFHAEPIKILYGRLIMGALFVAYAFGSRISIALPLAAVGIFLLLFPWIIVRGMAFNLGNTSYRNLRFGFRHDYAGSYRNYAISLLVLVFTLGIAYPYVAFRHARFKVVKSRYGQQEFRYAGGAGAFWRAYMLAIAAGIGCAFLVGILAFVLALIAKPLAFVAVPLIYLSLFVTTAFVRANVYNEVAAQSSLGELRFRARLEAGTLAWLYFSSVIASLLSLGLLIPWALVRVARYKIENTEVIGSPAALDSFVAAMNSQETAVADAAMDFWDIDLGF